MRRLVVVLAAVAVLISGCGKGDDESPAPKATTDLPPDGTVAMAGLYDKKLAPLGWKVQRSQLEEQQVDTAVSIPPGKRHLAVYLRPTGDPQAKDYLDALATVTRVFVPELFEQYEGLASFDVCLEPPEAQDPSAYPKPLTQVLLSRAQSAKLDWKTAEPADIVAGSNRHPNTVALFVSDVLKNSPEWAAIEKAAEERG